MVHPFNGILDEATLCPNMEPFLRLSEKQKNKKYNKTNQTLKMNQ